MTDAEKALLELSVTGYPTGVEKHADYERKVSAARSAVMLERLPPGAETELRDAMFAAWDALELAGAIRKQLPDAEAAISKLHAEWKKLRGAA